MFAHDRADSSEPMYPEAGTRIDNGALELVEILGVGGYGVVYRALDVLSPTPRQYAVKCLQHLQTQRQRQLHIREIALHQLCGAHPNVVTLHRVVEEGNHTFIIMDFAPDGDLFSQILYGCRYLGNTRLIKHVFNQLLDAVEYCHSLGIYHRDLKPENVLCFDGGYRIALTDFGLATTEKLSEEFRTGSVYHMSPECQGGEFSPTGSYSPMFNDVWSLGIVLLNLTTGRNPWKAATLSDSTFRAYLHSPAQFLLSVLPISSELNDVLVRMLDIDWRDRITIPEVRAALERVKCFYADGAIFDGSMARCPWEVGVDLEAAASAKPSAPRRSAWSEDSNLVFTVPDVAGSDSSSSTQYSSCGATWAFDSPASSSEMLGDKYIFERPRTPPPISVPVSPISPEDSFGPQRPAFLVTPSIVELPPRPQPKGARKPPLSINTNHLDPQFYTGTKNISIDSASTSSSLMRTAVDEEDPYASSFFLAGSKLSLDSESDGLVDAAFDDDKEMTSPFWADEVSLYCSTRSTVAHDRSATPSPDTEAAAWHDQSQFSSSVSGSFTDAFPPARFDPPAGTKPAAAAAAAVRRPVEFFAWRAAPAGAPRAAHAQDGRGQPVDPFESFVFHQAPSSPSFETWSAFSPAASEAPPAPAASAGGGAGAFARPGRAGGAPLKVIRPWLLRAKIFGSAGGRILPLTN